MEEKFKNKKMEESIRISRNNIKITSALIAVFGVALIITGALSESKLLKVTMIIVGMLAIFYGFYTISSTNKIIALENADKYNTLQQVKP